MLQSITDHAVELIPYSHSACASPSVHQ